MAVIGITGATDGIGRATARVLLAGGHRVPGLGNVLSMGAAIDTRLVEPKDLPDLSETVREPEDHSPLLVHGVLRDSQPVRRWLAQWWQPAAVRGNGGR